MSRADVRYRRRSLVLPKGGVHTYTTQACASGNSDAPALMASPAEGEPSYPTITLVGMHLR